MISVFSSMLERISHDEIFEFLQTTNTIRNNQAAFRKLYSTTTSLIASTHYWYENIDNSKINLTIFLDLKKSFRYPRSFFLVSNVRERPIEPITKL